MPFIKIMNKRTGITYPIEVTGRAKIKRKQTIIFGKINGKGKEYGFRIPTNFTIKR